MGISKRNVRPRALANRPDFEVEVLSANAEALVESALHTLPDVKNYIMSSGSTSTIHCTSSGDLISVVAVLTAERNASRFALCV